MQFVLRLSTYNALLVIISIASLLCLASEAEIVDVTQDDASPYSIDKVESVEEGPDSASAYASQWNQRRLTKTILSCLKKKLSGRRMRAYCYEYDTLVTQLADMIYDYLNGDRPRPQPTLAPIPKPPQPPRPPVSTPYPKRNGTIDEPGSGSAASQLRLANDKADMEDCLAQMHKVLPELPTTSLTLKKICTKLGDMIPVLTEELRKAKTSEEATKIFCDVGVPKLSEVLPRFIARLFKRVCDKLHAKPARETLSSISAMKQRTSSRYKVQVCSLLKKEMDELFYPDFILDPIQTICLWMETRMNKIIGTPSS